MKQVIIGFDKLEVAVFDGTEKDQENVQESTRKVIKVDNKENNGAAQELKVDGLGGETKKVYGSNGVAYVSTKPVGDLKVSAKLLGVALADQMRLVGGKKDRTGEIYDVSTSNLVPDCALLATAPTSDGKIAFMGFYRAKASLGDMNLKTTDDGAYEPEGDEFTFECATDGRTKTPNSYYVRGVVDSEEALKPIRQYVLRVAANEMYSAPASKKGKEEQ